MVEQYIEKERCEKDFIFNVYPYRDMADDPLTEYWRKRLREIVSEKV